MGAFAWWTETIQIRTLLSVFQKSGSVQHFIYLKNYNFILTLPIAIFSLYNESLDFDRTVQ